MAQTDNNIQSTHEENFSHATSSKEQILHDPYLALRYHNYRLFFIGSFIANLGIKMLEVAIGWDLFNRTGSAFILGLVGLILVIPVFCFSLPAGHVADRFNRKRIVMGGQALVVLASLGLTAFSFVHSELLFVYMCIFFMGVASAFISPAGSALFSQLVPDSVYENAATWNSSSWQLAAVLGPALGGFVIALSGQALVVYAFNAFAALICVILLFFVHEMPRQVETKNAGSKGATLRSLVEGISFLRKTQIILAAITLDMFAVLLGGATTLLPIFASTILHVGPAGLGWLRAAPSIGAICVALSIAHLPPFKRAGRTLLLAVIGFGAATVIFGLSRSFWLSLAMLFVLGGLDNISVVIRSTLLLLRTPDEMRGRVSAVNAVFIGASNELGGFESGLTAQLFGPTLSVVGGGIGTIVIVLLVALLAPELRHLGSLRPSQEAVAQDVVSGVQEL